MKAALQQIIGSRVRDVDGKVVGRIHEARAEVRGADCVITEWLVGPGAMLQRLGIAAGRLIGIAARDPLRIPWDKIDLSDLDDVRLTCRAEELPE